MGWLSLLIQGFKIASAIMDIFAAIQAKREFIEKMDGITAIQREALLREIMVEEDRLRAIADPIAFRAHVSTRLDEIVKRALSAQPGTVVPDVFGVAAPTSQASSPPATGGV